MRLFRVVSFVVFIFCLGSAGGCGGDPLGRQPISGTVTLDGAPLDEGSITFHPVEGGTTSSGAIIRRGEYRIPREKGLPQGKYRVTINAIKPGTGMTLPEGAMPGEEEGTPAEELIPPEWNAQSEHFIEVGTTAPEKFSHQIVTTGS